MTGSHTTKGNRRYSYYVCAAATKRGWRNCPAPSVAAGAIEQLVLQQIRNTDRQLASGEESTAWEALTLTEQIDRLRGLIERIEYDGAHAKVAIVFRPSHPVPADDGPTQPREDS
jgi:hypothetical protein